MNYYLATYIDLIQSIGFITLFTLTFIISFKLYIDNKKDIFFDEIKN